MSRQPRRVHMPAGFTPAGRKIRAHCTCGYRTTPRVDERRATEALESEHGETKPVCDLCGREHFEQGGRRSRRFDHLRVLVDDATGHQFLVCSDDEPACHDRARQQQVRLDRAAFEALGIELPRPTLRLIRGTGQDVGR